MSNKKTWKELNPQQESFLANFLDPNSETWGNYTQSALKAGYDQEYAENLSSQMPKWLKENLQDSNLVTKALLNLSEFLGDDDNRNLKWDASKFTLSRLAKNKFSERSELTGDKGAPLNITLTKYDDTDDPTRIQS
jgi:hypothetical protein